MRDSTVVAPPHSNSPLAVDTLCPTAGGRQLWAALGSDDRIRGAYQNHDPAQGVEPERLGSLLAEVDARVGVGSTLSACVQIATAVPMLASAPGDVAARALSDALAGRSVVSFAATDAVPGSDLTALETEIADEGDDIVLNGLKKWITNATQADWHLVLARHRPGTHFTNFTWVLVPADLAGVSVEEADTELFEGSGTGHIRFDGVRLSRDHMAGRNGRGLVDFAKRIAVERLAGALWGAALARRVLTETRDLLKGRTVRDTSMWHIDSIRQRFAACLALTRQFRALTDELAPKVAYQHDTTAGALLKASVAPMLDRVLNECAHLQGAEGFSRAGAQRLRAQTALFGIGGGTTEVVRSVIADKSDAILAELIP
ncbi:acyl-CoA dehydrogenase [Nocardiopsis terrae]|nr:acyl-CoA dehydrogenase [Nocardiopsis terrae]